MTRYPADWALSAVAIVADAGWRRDDLYGVKLSACDRDHHGRDRASRRSLRPTSVGADTPSLRWPSRSCPGDVPADKADHVAEIYRPNAEGRVERLPAPPARTGVHQNVPLAIRVPPRVRTRTIEPVLMVGTD